MKTLALTLVVLEVILSILIYFGCVYFRRRQQPCRPPGLPCTSANDSNNVRAGERSSNCARKTVLVFVPYSAAKAYLGKDVVVSLTCATCVQVFKDDANETLRLMPLCGHVFHPTCLVDPCSTLCPVCRAQPEIGGPDLRSGDIKVVEDNMISLSDEVTKKMIRHAKLVLPTGKFCSPARFLG
ncbi:unnamed protein product [Amaranthus hypochondriacus]